MNTTELLDIIENITGKRKLTLTVQEFADITGYPYIRVWKACRAGKLQYQQNSVGGKIRIDYREIQKIIDGKVLL